MFCAIWEYILETSEKLFSMIQSGCSVYIHFLKPLRWNIHELWQQAFIVMKITVHSFFYKSQQNWPLDLLFLKSSWLLGYIFLNLFWFSPYIFKIFHNTVMTYNTRNQHNDTTESQYFNAHAEGKQKLTPQCIVSKQIRCGH